MTTGNFIPTVLICLALMGVGIRALRLRRIFHTRAVATRALCVDVARDEKAQYTLLFEYEVEDGRTVRISSAGHRAPPVMRGEFLDIVYDPRRPGRYRWVSKIEEGKFFVPAMMALALAGLVVATTLYVTGR